jgi:hypothetical protein
MVIARGRCAIWRLLEPVAPGGVGVEIASGQGSSSAGGLAHIGQRLTTPLQPEPV